MVVLLALAACAPEGGDSGATCNAADTYSWENWGEGFFVTYCNACHAASSPNRFGAPVAARFDTLDEVRDQRDLIEALVVEAQTMPVGGGVRPVDLDGLEVFLACGL